MAKPDETLVMLERAACEALRFAEVVFSEEREYPGNWLDEDGRGPSNRAPSPERMANAMAAVNAAANAIDVIRRASVTPHAMR